MIAFSSLSSSKFSCMHMYVRKYIVDLPWDIADSEGFYLRRGT